MNQQQARWTLRVQRADGSWRDCGVFQGKGGGAVQGEDTKTFPGGMEPQEALASQATVENVTLTKRARLTDGDLQRFLKTRAGKASAVATGQPLDTDGNAAPGPPDVYTGVLLTYTPVEYDANSSDPSTFQVEISTHGAVG